MIRTQAKARSTMRAMRPRLSFMSCLENLFGSTIEIRCPFTRPNSAPVDHV